MGISGMPVFGKKCSDFAPEKLKDIYEKANIQILN
jgi:hypothetical protein